MNMNRRILALCTLLAVAWTALWPLVSSAHALATAGDMPLCHMAGMQVAADEPAMDMQSPSPQPGKQHCPLCIMGFLAMASYTPVIPAERIAPIDLSSAYREGLRPADLSVRLAESRAPPRATIIPA